MFLNETRALIFSVLIYLTCKHEQNIRFDYVTNSKVQDITSKDSKYFHINLLECKKLQFQHVTITAPADSPNTDGIHMGRSSQITITNADIGTGDDCISFGDGTQDITVNQVTCGPGHGISIGSLGRYQTKNLFQESELLVPHLAIQIMVLESKHGLLPLLELLLIYILRMLS